MSSITYKTRDTDCIIDVVTIAKQFTEITKECLGRQISKNWGDNSRSIKIIDKSLQNFITTHRKIRISSQLSPTISTHAVQILTDMMGSVGQIRNARYQDTSLFKERVSIFFDAGHDNEEKCISCVFDENGSMLFSQEMCISPLMLKQHTLTPFGCSLDVSVPSSDEDISYIIQNTAMFFDGDSINEYLKDKDEWKIEKEEEK